MLETNDIVTKTYPFVLSLLFLLINHYFAKNAIKPWIITTIIGLITTLISFIVINEKIYGILQAILFLIFTLCIMIKDNQLRSVFLKFVDWTHFIYSRLSFPNNEKIQRVLEKYNSSQGKFATLCGDYNMIYEQWRNQHRNEKRRPIIFFKMKLMKTIPWVDAVELKFLRDLKYIGFRIFIFIYDIPIDLTPEDTPRPISKHELVKHRKDNIKNIRKIVGCGATICVSSQFFTKEKNARYLHDLFFGSFLSDYIETYITKNIPNKTSYNDNQELKLRLLGYLGRVAVDILSLRNLLWIIQWEKRFEKWGNTYNLVCTRTITTDGKHIDKGKAIQLTDNLDTIKNKLKNDSKILKDELSEFCALFGGMKHTETNWTFFLEKASGVDIENIIQEMLSMEFIYGKKHDDIKQQLSDKKSINEIRMQIEKDLIFELAYLKILSIRILIKNKKDYEI